MLHRITDSTPSTSAGYLIVGGGIIGLAIARELIRCKKKNIVLVEKELTLGCHASGRNSGILHSGVYYSTDTRKARFCLEGNRLLGAYCRTHRLPLLATGKVIVTGEAGERERLHDLFERSRQNGSRSELIDNRRLAEIEPHARTVEEALWVPETAIVSPRAIIDCLERELAQSKSVLIRKGERFIEPGDTQTAVTDRGKIRFETLINAAGAHADSIARAFGLSERYRLLPFRGCYRKLRADRRDRVRGNIYPVPPPDNPFLGVHLSRSCDGEVYAGPTATPVFEREQYRGLNPLSFEGMVTLGEHARLFLRNRGVRANACDEIEKRGQRGFFRRIDPLLSGLRPTDLLPSTRCGIRPQLVDRETGELVMDFLIESDRNGIHILNAVSPAFTASFAFAREVVRRYL